MDYPLKVCLVLKDRGWIIEKMAVRLAENLINLKVDANISYLPSSQVDINHWMLYYYDMEERWHGKNTLAITHVDRPAKLHILKRRLISADMGICMSRMTLEQLVSSGIPRNKLCYITPAQDGKVKPKRIVIGITSQIRPDGAKGEDVLVQMAKTIRLDAFHFEIIGPNWEKVLPYFTAAGATVEWVPGAYQKDNAEHLKIVLERLNKFDYYLYMGWDEGSMGLLDALAAGIPTIVTPQGFHLDINGGITHPFSNAIELCTVFQKLSEERLHRIESVSNLTWSKYAYQHLDVWRTLLEGRETGINEQLHAEDTYLTPVPKSLVHNTLTNRFRFTSKGNFASIWEDFRLLWGHYLGNKYGHTFVFLIIRGVKRFINKIRTQIFKASKV